MPRWHERDGGRYIGTGHVVITRDPDKGWVNVGCYRVMVHDRNTMGMNISPGKHGRMHRQKYFDQGKPVLLSVASTSTRYYHDRDAAGRDLRRAATGAHKEVPERIVQQFPVPSVEARLNSTRPELCARASLPSKVVLSRCREGFVNTIYS